jgi:ADP-heptose:LPS heptosyltransferase
MIPQKILFIQTAFLGDVVLATPVIERLHADFPTAKLDFLVRKGNESLLKGHPHLRNILVWEKSRKYKSLWQLLQAIRAERYDWVINAQRFAGTGFLTAFSGAPTRIGFRKNPFSFLFTHRIPHPIGGLHETERNLSLLEPLLPKKTFSVRPQLYPSESDFESVKIYQSNNYVCMAPASVWFTKQYPAHRWVELVKSLPFEGKIYLIGGPGDSDLCGQILAESQRPNTENLCGKLNLLQSAALMKGALLNYVNDSGPMHLASSVNAPVCAIYCSTVPAFGFGPLSHFSKVVEVEKNLSCRPCGLHGHRQCPQQHFKCGEEILLQSLVNVFVAAKNNEQGV